MKYRELWKEENETIRERYELCMERIHGILLEETVSAPFSAFFKEMAEFVCKIEELVQFVEESGPKEGSIEELENWNRELYKDIVGEAYETSYANPREACEKLGEEYGKLLSFLYRELRGCIVWAYEFRMTDITIACELLIEIYNNFEEEIPKSESLQEILYWNISDYSDLTLNYRIREQLDPSLSFAKDIICESNLEDVRYLYQFGEYITENEIEISKFLNQMSEQEIEDMARTYTEGYRIGFVNAGIDLSKKKTVNIRYALGFERMIKAAISQFGEMGLEPVIYRGASHSINRRPQGSIGYGATSPNKQYDYDHREDSALYLDKKFIDRKLGVLRTSYEEYKELASVHAGPAVIEIFGEKPFLPEAKEEAWQLNEKQQSLQVKYNSESGQLVNEYIPGDERSFTIIAYPIPEIGENFREIFAETVKINTLDYKQYERIQACIIDALNSGVAVEIKGCGKNETDLKVQLFTPENLEKEVNFENCVADVNIPVGEVFTSPKLTGTTGRLHVSEVYLNELKYLDLKIDFADGKTTTYTCGNFEKEEDNQSYIKKNILFNHESLPMGEFAIGTNTTAYVMAKKYDIAEKLPILIAEKMGPHFALGDTCFSWSEDTKTYNPDGREMIAKDNECSLLRKEDLSKAYFNCHTDITIPYDELGSLEVIYPDGSKTAIIKNGRFVLEGTEDLNKPFEE